MIPNQIKSLYPPMGHRVVERQSTDKAKKFDCLVQNLTKNTLQ